ncbi:hypothetical protein MIT9_P2467 [Methylomarinovum caldicuralii]|uniref:Isochorismatase-like domain-containing protein n=1 Tax=Methylomarinovum caldicuralii TaxID=438856 RepID=A0AAU9CMG8_9GAMM|nr:isochorismatase family protein [Methylomarinovum caldicuralii]BCX82876.1 hypothetical protein MIT9_P2467 [Methylomarinovum caldicuralii]
MPLSPMLCDADQSQLVVVDIQPRLLEAMPEAERERMLATTTMLIQAAAALNVPVQVTEQYPEGLGATCEEIAAVLPPGVTPLSKTGFSCTCAAPFRQALAAASRSQIILTGQEAHVCVLQTAFALQGPYQVFLVEDAVCSRRPEHKIYALERMRQAGVVVVSGESVLFEWLRDAKHPRFKELARLIR